MAEIRSMSIWEQITLVQQWAPMLGYGQQLIAEKDQYKRALLVGDALSWIATKSSTKLDDDIVKLIVGIVDTPQGEALIRYIVAKVEGGT